MGSLYAIACVLFLAFLTGNAKVFRQRLGPPPDDAPNARATLPDWGTITQRVDHFNPSDLRQWEMRYLNNSQWFEDGGPMFIYLGGEWEISQGSIMTGQIFDMARDHGAYLFYTEHRYYGQSYPTEDISPENLQFLSLDQAIADVAYFIEYKKATIPGLANSQVMVVGGSYSASMATWARMKYPHLINIGYASSAPVRAVADFYEYYEVVNDNIELVSPKCLATIRESVEQLEEKLTTEEGLDYITDTFKMCQRARNDEPYRSYFFNVVVAEIFAGLVQYAGQTSIQDDCDLLDSFKGTSLDKLTGYVRDYFGDECIDDYDAFVEIYSSHNNTRDAYRAWIYQTCTEYGYYQTTTSDGQPFGNTFALKFFVDMCTDLFGETFHTDVLNTGIKRTNIMYGSLTPEITNVVSVHGTVDPWHALGILEDLNEAAPAILINGTSHCADLSSISEHDIPELKAAKLRVQELVTLWLSQGSN